MVKTVSVAASLSALPQRDQPRLWRCRRLSVSDLRRSGQRREGEVDRLCQRVECVSYRRRYGRTGARPCWDDLWRRGELHPRNGARHRGGAPQQMDRLICRAVRLCSVPVKSADMKPIMPRSNDRPCRRRWRSSQSASTMQSPSSHFQPIQFCASRCSVRMGSGDDIPASAVARI